MPMAALCCTLRSMEASMGKGSLAGRMAKGMAKKAVTRFMDRVGGKVVSGMTDTSSDAPDARFKPKRDLYSKMVSDDSDETPDKAE